MTSQRSTYPEGKLFAIDKVKLGQLADMLRSEGRAALFVLAVKHWRNYSDAADVIENLVDHIGYLEREIERERAFTQACQQPAFRPGWQE